ncbi:type II toxin-antitoxin system prevent-host-death family antitoxin (plasmid) [Rhizobium acidisoli]|uniref:Antitoxin n=1 Tax=Rhizobium acidisoli TaxID=1538158 RepID=A0AAE6C4M6_9HYPH|nr:type II toxin-antitoxin system prevent-host-death family antitoxin [Rhizobium acidisoli]KPH06311.1 prevent-host-death protein [Rhizobium acidisoli]QAS82109.1 type II toxin-antitoxin system prevent-host-death family antitoxin [Rhizobium acidisoli]
MNTKTVSTAEFIRHFGHYHDEARRAPITLTKHGRESLVVLSTELFERLKGNEDPRRVYAAGETPSDLAELLIGELDRQSADYKAGDHDG